MVNFRALNTQAVNFVYVPQSGSGNLVAVEQIVGEVESGNLIPIEQVIGKTASGNLTLIEQTLELRITGSGNLTLVEQDVTSTASGNLLTIEQFVYDDSLSAFYNRNGWDVEVRIGGELIETSKLHGNITIERKEGTAALADITLIPDLGTQDVVAYSGKSITIDARTISGVRRLFTGIVDIPDVKLIEKKIILRCSDRRQEKINSELADLVSTIGQYSDKVFNANDDDVATQLSHRLSTVPKTLDFDAYGTAYVTDLLAKATPDFTLSDGQVFRQEPIINLLSRARLVNSVTVGYKYRYSRLYHWTRSFRWTSPIDFDFCLFLRGGYQLTPKTMITQAVTAASWPIKGTITFTDTPPGGWYCGGIGWLGYSALGYYTQITDENGNTVSDSSGNALSSLTTYTGQQDITTLFATKAEWQAGTRWSQIVEEDYTFTVKAPQSIAQYGEVEGFVGTEFETESEATEWEDYQSYDDLGAGDNFVLDLDTERNTFNTIQNIAINQAKTKIITSHRDTLVTFYRDLWNQVELHNTVRVNTGPIQAKGKVFKIRHTLDINTGQDETEVTIALSKAQGSTTETVPQFLAKPSDTSFSPETSTIELASHYGEDPTTEAAASWSGYAGNITQGFERTFYTTQFVVDTPAVPDEYRQSRTIQGSAGGSYDIELQDDELVIIF